MSDALGVYKARPAREVARSELQSSGGSRNGMHVGETLEANGDARRRGIAFAKAPTGLADGAEERARSKGSCDGSASAEPCPILERKLCDGEMYRRVWRSTDRAPQEHDVELNSHQHIDVVAASSFSSSRRR